MTREERAYTFVDIATKMGRKGLKGLAKKDTPGTIIGALGGTALAVIATRLIGNKLIKQVALDKKNLDDTYSPAQRLMAEEMEQLNKALITSNYVGKGLGMLAGSILIRPTANPEFNEQLGAGIGATLGGTISELVTLKKKKRLDLLTVDFEDTLTKEQIKLRAILKLSSKKLGLTWTLAVVGGVLTGGFLGDTISKSINQNKIK